MPIQTWFSTPIYHAITTDFNAIQNEIQECYSKIDFSKHPLWGSANHSLSDPKFEENLIDIYNMSSLKSEIIFHTTQYLRIVTKSIYDIELLNSWITNTGPKEHTVVHNHGEADISGVYYFKTNTQDGKIYLLNPNPALAISKFLGADDHVEYPPQEGLFLLFPSWLFHGVRSNDTDDERISVSFNIRLHQIS